MDKEERVKEIARDIPFLTLEREVFVSCDRKEWHSWMLSEEDTTAIAKVLCDKEYRKESETAKEIFERVKALIENAKSKVYILGNTEFRKGYEKSIKDFDAVIDELRKEYGVTTEE